MPSKSKSPKAKLFVEFPISSQEAAHRLISIKPDRQKIREMEQLQFHRATGGAHSSVLLEMLWSSAQAAENEIQSNPAYLDLMGKMEDVAGQRPLVIGIYEEISSS